MMYTGQVLRPLVNYDSPRQLRAFLEERGLGMRKKHGQNFLINPRARRQLIDALEIEPENSVWEIGPGLGAMTWELLQRGANVTAFEIDPAFAKALREFFPHTEPLENQRFNLIEGDVMKTWHPASLLNQEVAKDIFLFGNLPYNIAAALLADFIENKRFFKRAVVTVQKEVAQRMAAKPASKDYSSFSVLCSSVYKITPLFVIKPDSFFPPPNVDSQGVRMDILNENKNLPLLFYPLVRALFSSRRKTIRNTLSNFASSVTMKTKMKKSVSSRGAAEEVFHRTGISGDRRPETLNVEEFAALAGVLEEVVFDWQ